MRIMLMAAAMLVVAIGGRPAFAQVPLVFNPYSEHFAQTVSQNPRVWQQLGAEATDVVAPILVAVEVTMSCGLYTELEASYSNGMVQSKEIPGDAATQSKLGNLFGLNRSIVTVVDQPCME
jgi:hypothetical protein